MFKILILYGLLTVIVLSSDCHHNQWKKPLDYIEVSEPSEIFHPNERILKQTYESIRIHADYSYLNEGSEQVKDYVQNQLMPSAISFYEAALKVIRLASPLKVKKPCYDRIPPEYLTNDGVLADLVILVVTDKLAGTVLAGAGACSLSTINNRPIYGTIVFNVNNLPFASVADQQENLITTLHELAHVFGFSEQAYEYYINPLTNKKLTNHIKKKIVNGQSVTLIDLDPLTERLKNYFDCPTLQGAYLENEGATGSAGSHFERRVFMNEFMTASYVADPAISEFTLALFEGTGWYQVDYSMAEPLTWGKGKGCSFVDDPCVSNKGNPNFDEFCGILTKSGCSYTSRGKATCGTTATTLTTRSKLPKSFNYWHNNTVVRDQYSDNCPYYWSPPWSDCQNSANRKSAILSEEVYGSTSKCFTGNLTKLAMPKRLAGYCFSTLCQNQDGNLSVIITIGSKNITCTEKQSVSIPGFQGKLDCPDPGTFCAFSNSMSCLRGCLGKGQCIMGKCECIDGWGGSDCGLRVYKDDCPKCVQEELNKACYGDICQCNPTTQNCNKLDSFEMLNFKDGGYSDVILSTPFLKP